MTAAATMYDRLNLATTNKLKCNSNAKKAFLKQHANSSTYFFRQNIEKQIILVV